MHIPNCLHLILSDIWTLSFLQHFLVEFLGTALFLSASLSAVLLLPAAGKPGVDLLSAGEELPVGNGNLSNLSAALDFDSPSSSRPLSNGQLASHLSVLPPSVPVLPRSQPVLPRSQPVLPPSVPVLPRSQPVLPRSQPVLPPCPLHVALAFGLSVAMAALCMGGEVHLNPAVTVAMTLTLRLRPWRAALYVIGQLLGGVASAALLLGLTGDVTPALNQLSSGVQPHQAVVVETLVTLQLVLVVLATARFPLPTVLAPLLVGLAVSLGHLVAMGWTGCGMNPARSFGPAVVTLSFHNHWVFWAGPVLGACLAALLNDLLLRPRWGCLGDWWAELKQLYPKDRQQPTLPHTP
ncbi:aquaporin-1-like [Centroberyx gerrardi]